MKSSNFKRYQFYFREYERTYVYMGTYRLSKYIHDDPEWLMFLKMESIANGTAFQMYFNNSSRILMIEVRNSFGILPCCSTKCYPQMMLRFSYNRIPQNYHEHIFIVKQITYIHHIFITKCTYIH